MEKLKKKKKEKVVVKPTLIHQQIEMLKYKKIPNWKNYIETFTFGLKLFLKSKAAYKLARESFQLPCPTILKEKYGGIMIRPGICSAVLNCLEFLYTDDEKFSILNYLFQLLELFTFFRYCILALDEISITPRIFYDKNLDTVSGFGTFGSSREKLAKHSLVFMLRNLTSKWKQAIGYHLTHALNATEVRELIADIIKNVYYKTKFQVYHKIFSYCL